MKSPTSRLQLTRLGLATVWVGASEFFRNQWVFLDLWERQYAQLGLTFETTPANGFLWLMWSLGLVLVIWKLLQKFSFWTASVISWGAAFPLMWIAIYNLQVLPLSLLVFAVPLSLLEVVVAAKILQQ